MIQEGVVRTGLLQSMIAKYGSEAYYAWPKNLPPEAVSQERTLHGPSRGREGKARRGRDRWRVAVERLELAGHDDVAQHINDYRNARNERAGWDAWLKSNFPALWSLLEDADD